MESRSTDIHYSIPERAENFNFTVHCIVEFACICTWLFYLWIVTSIFSFPDVVQHSSSKVIIVTKLFWIMDSSANRFRVLNYIFFYFFEGGRLTCFYNGYVRYGDLFKVTNSSGRLASGYKVKTSRLGNSFTWDRMSFFWFSGS